MMLNIACLITIFKKLGQTKFCYEKKNESQAMNENYLVKIKKKKEMTRVPKVRINFPKLQFLFQRKES